MRLRNPTTLSSFVPANLPQKRQKGKRKIGKKNEELYKSPIENEERKGPSGLRC